VVSNHSNSKTPDLGKNLVILAVTGFHQLIYPKIRSLADQKQSFHQLTSKIQNELAGESVDFFLNQISQSWRVRFTCLNSRSTSRNPNISNGAFKSAFGTRESSQMFPTILGIIL
jgi:hypothetical protein